MRFENVPNRLMRTRFNTIWSSFCLFFYCVVCTWIIHYGFVICSARLSLKSTRCLCTVQCSFSRVILNPLYSSFPKKHIKTSLGNESFIGKTRVSCFLDEKKKVFVLGILVHCKSVTSVHKYLGCLRCLFLLRDQDSLWLFQYKIQCHVHTISSL